MYIFTCHYAQDWSEIVRYLHGMRESRPPGWRLKSHSLGTGWFRSLLQSIYLFIATEPL